MSAPLSIADPVEVILPLSDLAFANDDAAQREIPALVERLIARPARLRPYVVHDCFVGDIRAYFQLSDDAHRADVEQLAREMGGTIGTGRPENNDDPDVVYREPALAPGALAEPAEALATVEEPEVPTVDEGEGEGEARREAPSADESPIEPGCSRFKALAVALAREGHRVFPLGINGKVPATTGDWQRIATQDPAVIGTLWRCPVFDVELDYNVGIALERDTMVVDVDVRDGKRGKEQLEQWEAANGKLPGTYTVVSASGGEHRYYRVDDSATFPGKLTPDIDLKKSGGYVVAPGSEIDGVPYEPRDYHEPLADCPPALAQLSDPSHAAPRPPKGEARTPLVEPDAESAVCRAIEYLHRAPKGGTFARACRVKDFGISLERCLELMLVEWRDYHDIPKDDGYVEFRVGNAYEYGRNAPGVASAEAELGPVAVSDRPLPASVQARIDAARKAANQFEDEKPSTPAAAEPTDTNTTPLPFVAADSFRADDLPPREWVWGAFLARGFVSVLVAPPGSGKSNLGIHIGLAIAAGREDVTGFKVHKRGRVAIWNNEDDANEQARRVIAAKQAHGISDDDIKMDGKPGLFIASGAEHGLLLAGIDSSGHVRATKAVGGLKQFIRDNDIDVLMLDPFVELHGANENDNVQMATVSRIFRNIAVEMNVAVLIVHHTRKPPAAANRDTYAGNMDTARGAGAILGVARMAATFYTLDEATGKKYGIKAEDCHRYARFDDAKSNLALMSTEPRLFRRDSVLLGGIGGEEVGVLRPVKLDRVPTTADESAAIQGAIRDMLREAPPPHCLTIAELADSILEAGIVAHVTPANLQRRIKAMFVSPVTFPNSDNPDKRDTIHLDTISRTGKPGRAAALFGDFADIATDDKNATSRGAKTSRKTRA